MEPLDDKRATTPLSVALLDASRLSEARVLPLPPTNVADVLNAAVERLEEFLEDVYIKGRSIGDPTVIWANGAPYMIREILDSFPVERLTVD